MAKRVAKIAGACVACGCCVPVCPFDAISIDYGVNAAIDPISCVGCGRCEKACPAGIIDIVERGGDV